jgi:hypothetical protein
MGFRGPVLDDLLEQLTGACAPGSGQHSLLQSSNRRS